MRFSDYYQLPMIDTDPIPGGRLDGSTFVETAARESVYASTFSNTSTTFLESL